MNGARLTRADKNGNTPTPGRAAPKLHLVPMPTIMS